MGNSCVKKRASGKGHSLSGFGLYDLPKPDGGLDCLVEGTGDNVSLLLRGQFDEVHGIAGHADCQLGIVLRMLLRI